MTELIKHEYTTDDGLIVRASAGSFAPIEGSTRQGTYITVYEPHTPETHGIPIEFDAVIAQRFIPGGVTEVLILESERKRRRTGQSATHRLEPREDWREWVEPQMDQLLEVARQKIEDRNATLLSLREAAEWMEVRPDTLRQAANDGRLAAERIDTTRGPVWMVTRGELERYRRERRPAPPR